MTKDYYKILGITEFESTENIKKAYHKLVRTYHPDIAGNEEELLSKFKDINEAYHILSDKVKRTEYDKMRSFYAYAQNNSNKYYSTNPNNTTSEAKSEMKNKNTSKQKFSFKWNDFFDNTFKNPTHQKSDKQRGKDIFTEIEISFFEAIEGTEKIINLLQTETCPKCKGRKFTNGTKCDICNGKGTHTSYKKFTVKIPAGIKDGSKIRLAKEGTSGINGGENGDLYIKIHVKSAPNYKTDGLNILKTVPILPHEAVLGCNLNINTLDGNYNIKIAPRTQNGQKIRLAGCGIMQNNKVGDMILTVEIKIPENITAEEIDLYKKLAKFSSGNLRENL